MIFEYIDAAGLRDATKDAPLFRTAFEDPAASRIMLCTW